MSEPQRIRRAEPHLPPPGFQVCNTCAGYNGKTRGKYLRGPTLGGPEAIIEVQCRCRGPRCPRCGEGHVYEPGTLVYDGWTHTVDLCSRRELEVGCPHCTLDRDLP